MIRLLALLLLLFATPASADVLRGVNLNGLGTPGEQTPRMEAIDYYKAKGFNAFRVPVQWELIQPKLGGPLDPVTVKRMRDVISRVGPSATVVIDVHNSGRYRGKVLGETSETNLVHLSILWDLIARTFSGPNIIYNVMNEPHDMSDGYVVAMMNTGIAAIRRAGRTNLILVSGNGWSNRASLTRGHPNWTIFSQIVDSGGRWAIDAHIYLDAWSAGQSATIDPIAMRQVEELTAEARNRRKQVFVGEWAVASDPASLVAGRKLRAHMEANSDVYIGWAWWAGGGWWPADYLYLLDPYGSQWDEKNPDRDWRLGGSSKASTWSGPLKDRPQMTILAD